MFWRKKEQEPSKIDTEVYKRLANVEAKVENLDQLLKNLRGVVNRRLGNYEMEGERREDLNKAVLLPDYGITKFNQ
jgi:hypothetical protein